VGQPLSDLELSGADALWPSRMRFLVLYFPFPSGDCELPCFPARIVFGMEEKPHPPQER
jgi:hypothetical protein